MANMHDVLIAVELAISLRFGAFVLKWVMMNIAWIFWTITPYVFLFPTHLIFVQATPLLAFFRCVTDTGYTKVSTDKVEECVYTSGIMDMYTEFLNPDTMQQDMVLIRSSMDLFYNGSLVILSRALGHGIVPLIGV